MSNNTVNNSAILEKFRTRIKEAKVANLNKPKTESALSKEDILKGFKAHMEKVQADNPSKSIKSSEQQSLLNKIMDKCR